MSADWHPIVDKNTVFVLQNGTIANNCVIRLFTIGKNSEPLSMATDKTGSTTQPFCRTNRKGKSITFSFEKFQIHADRPCILALFLKEENINDINAAEWHMEIHSPVN